VNKNVSVNMCIPMIDTYIRKTQISFEEEMVM